MEEDYRFKPDYDENKFASHGTGEGFEWFAYANSYDTSLHHITPELKNENSRGKQRWGIREQYFKAINSNFEFRRRVKFPYVENSGQIFPSSYPLACFVDALRSFFRTFDIPNDTNISEDTSVSQIYKGKDIIIPLIHADAEYLEAMRIIAEQYSELGCRSVTALFVYRIKPDLNNNYPDKKDYPYFSDLDFAGKVESSDEGEGPLGALLNSLKALEKDVYIGGL